MLLISEMLDLPLLCRIAAARLSKTLSKWVTNNS
nr:MAG TPA: hypothetical protein [Caudoviricetes sp.]